MLTKQIPVNFFSSQFYSQSALKKKWTTFTFQVGVKWNCFSPWVKRENAKLQGWNSMTVATIPRLANPLTTPPIPSMTRNTVQTIFQNTEAPRGTWLTWWNCFKYQMLEDQSIFLHQWAEKKAVKADRGSRQSKTLTETILLTISIFFLLFLFHIDTSCFVAQ